MSASRAARRAVTIVLLAVLVAGCAGEPPRQPVTLPPLPATPSATASPSVGVTASARPSPSPSRSARRAPSPGASASPARVRSAERFVRAYFDEHIRAVNTNDFSRLQRMFVSTCKVCVDQYKTFKAYADRGGRFEGAHIDATQPQGRAGLHGEVIINTTGRARPGRLVNRKTGRLLENFEGSSTFGWTLHLSPKDDTWRVTLWLSVFLS